MGRFQIYLICFNNQIDERKESVEGEPLQEELECDRTGLK